MTTVGRGGFGYVQKIELKDGTFAAKKTLRLTEFEDENNELIRRFQREATYQQRFNHPNIVQILHSDLEAVPPYFVMPLASCNLANGALLPYDEKVKAFIDVLHAIKEIHSKGHVHRDIKPENILKFDYPDGTHSYAISDFGLIAPSDRSNTTNITSTNVGLGTQNYMAPECYLNSKEASSKSDIYSLGVLLLFLFKRSGESLGFPYEERSSKCAFGSIIKKCTKRDISSRFQTIDELGYAFNEAIGL